MKKSRSPEKGLRLSLLDALILAAQSELDAGVKLGRIVEVDTRVLRAYVYIPKGGLQRARRIDSVRARSRKHSRDGSAA